MTTVPFPHRARHYRVHNSQEGCRWEGFGEERIGAQPEGLALETSLPIARRHDDTRTRVHFFERRHKTQAIELSRVGKVSYDQVESVPHRDPQRLLARCGFEDAESWKEFPIKTPHKLLVIEQ